MHRLAGKVAFVTGAGRGIGRAIAEAFAAEGAAVGCAARTRHELDDAVAAIGASGGRALAVECDVTDEAAVQRAVDATCDEFGGLDIAIANAGVSGPRVATVDLATADFRAVVDINLFGFLHTAKAAVPALRRRGGGHIVLIGSGAGRRAYGVGYGPYCASKAAAALLMRNLALELRADSIAVNEIVPGPVLTRLTGAGEVDESRLRAQFSRDEWVKQPDDVAPLALFVVTQPLRGPTGQMYSLLGREL